ncbi:hypothetical protein M758_12G051100 [Ceratodon purpureus]|nr:hypothetical protein M758_12G051100 [Ceratodon purpureus]
MARKTAMAPKEKPAPLKRITRSPRKQEKPTTMAKTKAVALQVKAEPLKRERKPQKTFPELYEERLRKFRASLGFHAEQKPRHSQDKKSTSNSLGAPANSSPITTSIEPMGKALSDHVASSSLMGKFGDQVMVGSDVEDLTKDVVRSCMRFDIDRKCVEIVPIPQAGLEQVA